MLKTQLPELNAEQSENTKKVIEYLSKLHDELDHHLNVLYGRTKSVNSESNKIVSKAKLKERHL